MKFLIQNNLMGQAQLELVRKAVTGLPHQFVSLVPFTHEITSDDPLNDDDDVIPYGSTLLTTVGYLYYNWYGLYFDLANFNYETALRNRKDMLNDGVVVSIEEAIRILNDCQPHQDWFVRPSLDLKQFAGLVIEAKECADWFIDAMECDSSGSYHMNPATQVVLAKPKTIQAEWRWFIVGGKAVSGSMYRLRGQLIKEREKDVEVIKEAQKLASDWLPNACCVMDTALVDNELKVIEFNCINSSGFYNHDVGTIFSEIYKYSTELK